MTRETQLAHLALHRNLALRHMSLRHHSSKTNKDPQPSNNYEKSFESLLNNVNTASSEEKPTQKSLEEQLRLRQMKDAEDAAEHERLKAEYEK